MKNFTVGIAGAGNMGKQLALLFASCGISTILWNYRYQDKFENEFARLAKIQAKLGLIDNDLIPEIIERVEYTNTLSEFQSCTFIIEAVTEELNVKSDVIKQIVQYATSAEVVCTNTSTLSITELASHTENPTRFIGVHFFNPPMSMKLVEVIKGELTSVECLDSTLEVIGKINKSPVILSESPGFIVNRLLFPMINEAVFLFSEGVADAKTIDSCMRLGANHPMGPLELADLIGLDVCLSILQTLVKETGDGKYRPAPLLKRYVRAGKIGKKAGIGFYSYRKPTNP